MKNMLGLLAIIMGFTASAQFSVNGGLNTLNAFGVKGSYAGMHLGFEIPRDDAISLYGRVSHYFSRKSEDSIVGFGEAIDIINTFPSVINGLGIASMNYTIIEGGTRYYLGDGFDYGWAAYGGTTLKLVFNQVKTEFETIDESLYTISGNSASGNIINFGVGLNGGVKYTLAPYGTFYADLGGTYQLLNLASNVNVNSDRFSNVFFEFSIGYRKDIGW